MQNALRHCRCGPWAVSRKSAFAITATAATLALPALETAKGLSCTSSYGSVASDRFQADLLQHFHIMTPIRSLSALPSDILALIIAELDARSLARLQSCSSTLSSVAQTHGWPALDRLHRANAASLRPATTAWTPKQHVRFGLAVDKAWNEMDAAFIQLGPTWQRRCLPVLDLDETNERLLVGVGPDLQAVGFDGRSRGEVTRTMRMGRAATDDLTGVMAVPGTCDVVIGSLSGTLRRVRMEQDETRSIATYASPTMGGNAKMAIEALSATSELIATASTARLGARRGASSGEAGAENTRGTGTVSLYALKSPWQAPYSLSVSTKPWSVHILSNTTLAVGHSGHTPLSTFALRPSGIDELSRRDYTGPPFKSAVYAFAPYPAFSPRDDLILTGWYDGVVRLYDIRQSTSTAAIELGDAWSADAVYSLASSPSLSHQVTVGTARHSSIKLGDLRRPVSADTASGYAGLHTTIYAAADQSPIYSVACDGKARVFGVTERRAFMLDFKPGAVEDRWESGQGWTRPRYARADDALKLRLYGEDLTTMESKRDEGRWESGQPLPERRGTRKGGRRR